jgi:tetratricopeptide (TPR) repeat protein
VSDRHLSLETMAKWLTGRLEHDEMLREVVPHHLRQCPACRETYQELQALKEELGHWDEEVALFEGREAPELAGLLEARPVNEQAELIEEEESLHTWGLCQLLLRKSLAAVRQDPGSAFDLADHAVRLTAHLGEAYDRQWVLGLRARALAYRANARRVLAELRGAEADFRKARACLARSAMEGSRVEAEVLDLESSLRRDQRRFGEARKLAERALALYRQNQDSHGSGKVLLQMAKILEESNDLNGAIALLERPFDGIDPEREPQLYACARYNLVSCLSDAGRYEEAERLLPEVRERFRSTAEPLDRVRLRWTEGGIAYGLGRTADAESAFR